MEINKATAENIDLSLTFVKAKDDCDDLATKFTLTMSMFLPCKPYTTD
jgi:hypothetical protein